MFLAYIFVATNLFASLFFKLIDTEESIDYHIPNDIIPTLSNDYDTKRHVITMNNQEDKECLLRCFKNILLSIGVQDKNLEKSLVVNVRGVAGSGKTRFVADIVSSLSQLHGTKKATILTNYGFCFYNIGAVTFRQFMYDKSKPTRNEIACLILNGNSFLSPVDLAMLERLVSHRAYRGVFVDKLWAVIKLVVVVSDDFQLPPPCEPTFQILKKLQFKVKYMCQGI